MDNEEDLMIIEWEKLKRAEEKINNETIKVNKEWFNIEKKHVIYQKRRDEFEKLINSKFNFLPMDNEIKINIGGQIFVDNVKTWTRDRFSILAYICIDKTKKNNDFIRDDNEHIKKDSSNTYYFDRDWWIFRYIYLFLRDKTLPESIDILRELYYEASFYRLKLLQNAIEANLLDTNEEIQLSESYSFPIYKTNNKNEINMNMINKKKNDNQNEKKSVIYPKSSSFMDNNNIQNSLSTLNSISISNPSLLTTNNNTNQTTITNDNNSSASNELLTGNKTLPDPYGFLSPSRKVSTK